MDNRYQNIRTLTKFYKQLIEGVDNLNQREYWKLFLDNKFSDSNIQKSFNKFKQDFELKTNIKLEPDSSMSEESVLFYKTSENGKKQGLCINKESSIPSSLSYMIGDTDEYSLTQIKDTDLALILKDKESPESKPFKLSIHLSGNRYSKNPFNNIPGVNKDDIQESLAAFLIKKSFENNIWTADDLIMDLSSDDSEIINSFQIDGDKKLIAQAILSYLGFNGNSFIKNSWGESLINLAATCVDNIKKIHPKLLTKTFEIVDFPQSFNSVHVFSPIYQSNNIDKKSIKDFFTKSKLGGSKGVFDKTDIVLCLNDPDSEFFKELLEKAKGADKQDYFNFSNIGLLTGQAICISLKKASGESKASIISNKGLSIYGSNYKDVLNPSSTSSVVYSDFIDKKENKFYKNPELLSHSKTSKKESDYSSYYIKIYLKKSNSMNIEGDFLPYLKLDIRPNGGGFRTEFRASDGLALGSASISLKNTYFNTNKFWVKFGEKINIKLTAKKLYKIMFTKLDESLKSKILNNDLEAIYDDSNIEIDVSKIDDVLRVISQSANYPLLLDKSDNMEDWGYEAEFNSYIKLY